MSKRFSVYIASVDYFDKSLIFLSVATGSISVIGTVIAPAEMVSASFSLAFSISAGIIKKLLKTTRNKKKKHNKIVTLARSKLNSIDFFCRINSMKTFMIIINEEKIPKTKRNY